MNEQEVKNRINEIFLQYEMRDLTIEELEKELLRDCKVNSIVFAKIIIEIEEKYNIQFPIHIYKLWRDATYGDFLTQCIKYILG